MIRKTPRTLGFYERKLATCLLGATSMLWALVPYMGSGQHTLFTNYIREATRGDLWFAVMFIIGMLQLFGGACPRRSLRHFGLMMGAFVWGATFLMFMAKSFITPVTVSMGLFSAFSVLILLQDTRMKPRDDADE